MPETPKYTYEQKVAAFRRTSESVQDRVNFMESRAAVVLGLLDEQSTVRDIYAVERVPAGGSTKYDIPFDDINMVFLMPQIGSYPSINVEGDEIYVDTFALHGGVDWQEDVARDGRFQVVERATRLLANKFIRQEELHGWSLIRAHAAALPSTQKLQAYLNSGSVASPGAGIMNIFTLAEALTLADELGNGGRRITDIYMSPRRFNDLRTQAGNSALPDDMRSAAWNNGRGNIPTNEIRFHKVYNRTLVANNKAYAFAQREGFNYGVMPIRSQVRTRDNPMAMTENKQGVLADERIGFGVLDDKGLIEITF